MGLCGDYDDTEKKYAGIVKHRIQVEEVILIVPPRLPFGRNGIY